MTGLLGIPGNPIPPTLPPIDFRFLTEPEPGGERINGLSSYMNSLFTLINLSFQPFEAMMEPTYYSYRPFQNVEIMISGVPEQSPIQRRFAVWGIYEALSDIAVEPRPDGGRWVLQWEGLTVGTIDYSPLPDPTSGPRSQDSNVTSPTSAVTAGHPYQSSISSAPGSDLTLGLFSYPLPLTVNINYLSDSIRINDFIMAIANAVTGCAQFSEYDHSMTEFIALPLGFNSLVYVRWFDKERMQPQPLLYGYVIGALAEITKRVYLLSAYKELDALVDVTDGDQKSSIAIVRIRKRPPSVAGEVD